MSCFVACQKLQFVLPLQQDRLTLILLWVSFIVQSLPECVIPGENRPTGGGMDNKCDMGDLKSDAQLWLVGTLYRTCHRSLHDATQFIDSWQDDRPQWLFLTSFVISQVIKL